MVREELLGLLGGTEDCRDTQNVVGYDLAADDSGAIDALLSARDHCKAHQNGMPISQRPKPILAAEFLRRQEEDEGDDEDNQSDVEQEESNEKYNTYSNKDRWNAEYYDLAGDGSGESWRDGARWPRPRLPRVGERGCSRGAEEAAATCAAARSWQRARCCWQRPAPRRPTPEAPALGAPPPRPAARSS
ncbi:unnamed protein product [Prorocentrum cordatum]|uniref:Uncharacterized protein n=1 Tax=Prorocentrum cordatum TaxID=2364126 RepID=A0ABN9VZV8_9DINO|nr:unnamed protein product [Polarella glacialis]